MVVAAPVGGIEKEVHVDGVAQGCFPFGSSWSRIDQTASLSARFTRARMGRERHSKGRSELSGFQRAWSAQAHNSETRRPRLFFSLFCRSFNSFRIGASTLIVVRGMIRDDTLGNI